MKTAARSSRAPARKRATRRKSGNTGATRGPYGKSSGTQSAILAAAFEEAAAVGLHRASVVNIARRAGVAVGNVHYHFGSRDKLLCEMLEALSLEYRAHIGRAAATQGSFFPAFEATVRAHLEYLRRNPALMRLEEESRLYYPKLYRRNVETFVEQTSDAVQQAAKRGDLQVMSKGERTVVAYSLMGMIHFFDQLLQNPGYPGDLAVVTACTRLIRQGLNAKP